MASQLQFAQWIPWTLFEQELDQRISQLHYQENNIPLRWNDWTPSVSDFQLDLQASDSGLKIGKDGIDVSYVQASASLKIGNFLLDQTIIRKIGGNQIAIRIKVNCQPFEIKVPSLNAQVHADFQNLSGFWTPKATNTNLRFLASPSVSQIQCEGPMGIEKRVSELVTDSLNDPQVLGEFITGVLNSQLQKQILAEWEKNQKAAFPNLEIFGSSEPFDEGIFLKLNLNIGKGTDIFRLDSNSLTPPSIEPSRPKLLLGQDNLTRLLEAQLSNFSVVKYDLQQIDDFKKLMKNRFLQFFTWSDLLHYSRNTPFLMNVNKVVSAHVTSLSPGHWDVQMQATGNVESPRKGQLWSYLEWSLGIKSQLEAHLIDGKLKIESQGEVSALIWKYGQAYKNQFSPSGGSTKILKKALEKSLASRGLALDLPQFELTGKNWHLENLNFQQNSIWLDWMP